MSNQENNTGCTLNFKGIVIILAMISTAVIPNIVEKEHMVIGIIIAWIIAALVLFLASLNDK